MSKRLVPLVALIARAAAYRREDIERVARNATGDVISAITAEILGCTVLDITRDERQAVKLGLFPAFYARTTGCR